MSDVPLTPETTQAYPDLGEAQGLLKWVSSVDHKQIGVMYLIVTLAFFIVGGLEALLIRMQLAQPTTWDLTHDQERMGARSPD